CQPTAISSQLSAARHVRAAPRPCLQSLIARLLEWHTLMLRSLAVLVLLVSLAAATPVVCLCMPTDQGYLPLMSLGAPESVSPAAGSVARVQIGHVGVTRPDGAPSDPAGRTHAQQPAG